MNSCDLTMNGKYFFLLRIFTKGFSMPKYLTEAPPAASFAQIY